MGHVEPDRAAGPQRLIFKGDGRTPNNRLPVLVHQGTGLTDAGAARDRLAAHGWGGAWVNGVFDYHHYHATMHEVLVVISGTARLMLGGAAGQEVEVAAGDALILPAGTGHCRLSASADFRVVGAYPGGGAPDIRRADPALYAESARLIEAVPRPDRDPVTGSAIWT
ncbi:cupin domain-containing protein [Paracoccus pacificus]|uniref:Cupin domain-containing protein n=1 Tax=Paracoccus pacificus TaxID=1463598 RepID=A0ABW4R898_9RHOB